MKTAEVAIEHVLTGVLTLCAFVLPLLPAMNVNWGSLETETLIGVLGIAYLFGVLFDTVADTLLSPFEQWLRFKQPEEWCNQAKDGDEERLCLSGDPFPQDALEFALRQDDDGRLEWMDSLRSRIRTARGLAVFGLPAAAGIVVYRNGLPGPAVYAQASLGWCCYPVAILIAALFVSLLCCKCYPIPRTSKLLEGGSWNASQMTKAKKRMLIGALTYALIPLVSAVIIDSIATYPLRPSGRPESIAVGICGGAVGLSSLWAWWKITKTYMRFINLKLPELLEQSADEAR